MKRYLVVIEQTSTGYSAYPCVATGRTRDEVEQHMQEAIEFHLQGMRLGGYELPEPHSYSAYVKVPA
jgi:predicted RNase H-like HicB family nuclease